MSISRLLFNVVGYRDFFRRSAWRLGYVILHYIMPDKIQMAVVIDSDIRMLRVDSMPRIELSH